MRVLALHAKGVRRRSDRTRLPLAPQLFEDIPHRSSGVFDLPTGVGGVGRVCSPATA